ncbi:MAG TPA: SDR family oxidoreductase [bacterium]|nr:SDR family oxidoreductase [bacterium]
MDMKGRFSLKGKNAMVTGSGQGLGKAFALTLAEAGANIAVIDIDMDKANRTADEIGKSGHKSIAIEADVSAIEDINRAVEKVVSEFGKLDIAVNNAGVSPPIKDSVDISAEIWDKTMGVNLRGLFFCAQAEAKAMMPNRYGKIINIASICGHIVWPKFQAVYSISKAGVIHLTRCLAVEWAPHGIRVNSISPGVTMTPDLFPDVPPIFLRKAPLGKTANVEDIASAVLYLASSGSDFMVGQDMVLDGGYTLL